MSINALLTSNDYNLHCNTITVTNPEPTPTGPTGPTGDIGPTGATGATGTTSTQNAASIVQTNSVNTMSKTFVDMTDMTLTLDTGTTVLISYVIPLQSDNNSTYGNIIICNSGATVTYLSGIHSITGSGINSTFSGSTVITTLTPGSNTFKMQWCLSNSFTPTMISDGSVADRSLSVIPLN